MITFDMGSGDVTAYNFYKRDDNGIHHVGTAIPGVSMTSEIASVLADTRTLDGTAFDKNNPKHWEQLPAIYSGTRFWVKVAPQSVTKQRKLVAKRIRHKSSKRSV